MSAIEDLPPPPPPHTIAFRRLDDLLAQHLVQHGQFREFYNAISTILRDYLGGMNSVRGYEESEIGGDNSIVGSLELRTPLLENFIPGLKSDDPQFYEKYPQHWSQHRLQFVAFTDFGYVSEKKREVADDDQELWSVGAGIRLGLTKYAQMSLDYGYPIIEASDDTPSSGRLHVSLQMQF